jgi:ABC-type transport system involved in multi-copper enzyme maturation permease subunit
LHPVVPLRGSSPNGYWGYSFYDGNYYYDSYFADSSDEYLGGCYDEYRSLTLPPSGSLALVFLPLGLLGSSVIFVVVGIYFGASLVGADWHHRSMTTLLTWESRRWRVYVARMGTLVFGTFLVVLGLEAFGGVGLAIAAAFKGTLVGADGLWLRTTVDVAIKVAALSAVAAAITASVAMIFRSTGAALGLLIAYFGYEQLMQAISPTTNFWVLGRSAVTFVSPISTFDALGLDFPSAVAALAMYTAAFLIVGFLTFDRRDVS